MEKLRKIIGDADFVLIGIGSEFGCKDIEPELMEIYSKKKEETPEEDWVVPFLESFGCENELMEKIKRAYDNLYELVKDKNYFVVTLNNDDKIMDSPFLKDKITAPCGSLRRLQCVQGCKDSIVEGETIIEEVIADIKKSNLSLDEIPRPICSQCGREMVMNTVEQEKYMEEGYIKSWEKYRMWLTGTLNKKICLLELGVDFKYPSIIRWAFEKVAFINEKAVMVRINEKYPQLTEELQGKAYSYEKNSVEFFQ